MRSRSYRAIARHKPRGGWRYRRCFTAPQKYLLATVLVSDFNARYYNLLHIFEVKAKVELSRLVSGYKILLEDHKKSLKEIEKFKTIHHCVNEYINFSKQRKRLSRSENKTS